MPLGWRPFFQQEKLILRENFETSLRHILRFEGGYVDHPADPGGATNLGITRDTLARFRGRPVSKAEVRALGRDTAREIYRKFYWDALRCDEMPGGLDLALFDCGVNQGTSRAARLLQTALRITVDGIIGPVTIRSAKSADRATLLTEFMALRMRAYGRLSRLFRTFGLGWSRRLMSAHSAAQALIDRGCTVDRVPDTTQAPPQPNSDPERKDSLMNFILDRLREPSTFAGVAAFLAGVGIFGLSENEWNQIFGAITSVAGVVAMLMRDGGGTSPAKRPSGEPSQTGGEAPPEETWPFER